MKRGGEMTLSNLLEERNMTKYRLGKISGVPQATISDICTGKTKIEKCSAETIYKIARALNVSMEELLRESLENKKRPTYENFRCDICHELKNLGDMPFLISVIEKDQIRDLYDRKWYVEALYLLSLVDYVSRINDIPLCTDYNDIRRAKLEKTLYPSSVSMLCRIKNSEQPKKEYLCNAIPEFLMHNIAECEVRDVC